MKNLTRILKKVAIGSLCRVKWPDASGDVTGDGSPEIILRDHEAVIYDTYGLYIGVSKGDVILTSDKRFDKDEFRGTLNIPKKWVMEFEVILPIERQLNEKSEI